jgi:hypothetical protein
MRNLLALLAISCGSNTTHTASRVVRLTAYAAPVVTSIDAPSDSPEQPTAATPSSPATIGTVVVLKNVALHRAPRLDSALVGIVSKGTRSAVLQIIDGAPACTTSDGVTGRWLELAPRGWTCATATEPTAQPPTQAEAFDLADDHDGEVHPIRGVYGMVRSQSEAFATTTDAESDANARMLEGSNTVRAVAVVTVAGKRFWRTSQGALIDEGQIIQISPSTFKGVAISDPDVLPAWVHAHGDPYQAAKTRATPSPRGKLVGARAPRTVVTIEETSPDGRYVRVGEGEWLDRADVRIATLAAPPPGTGDDDKWFDIDRDEQVLVAYEGTRPVYATLVSTGTWQHETPTVIARIASKHELAVMSSTKESVYSVADVPWTMYYDGDFALHTSYWHDGFGSPRSHGCVNLAPRDARALYRWSSPNVPPGWSSVFADEQTPGSLVRIRTHRDPEPAFRGYALAMHDRATEVASAR